MAALRTAASIDQEAGSEDTRQKKSGGSMELIFLGNLDSGFQVLSLILCSSVQGSDDT